MRCYLPRITQDDRKRRYRHTSYQHHLKKANWISKHHQWLCMFLLTFFAGVSIFILIHSANVETNDDNKLRLTQAFCRKYSTLCFDETTIKRQNHIITNNNNNNQAYPLPEHHALSYAVSHIKHDTFIHNEAWASLPVQGVLYMAIRNEDLQKVRESMRSLEDRFNHRWHYPWVLLCTEGFTEDFIKYTSSISSGPIYYGKIDPEAFAYPSWTDFNRIKKSMENSDTSQDLSVLQMKRYQAGLFYHHSLFQNVKYIWRIEPGMTFYCRMTDSDDDPFEKMVRNNKTFGFTVTRRHQQQQKVTQDIWKLTQNYMNKNQNTSYQAHPEDQTIMQALIGRDGYNSCHFWSLFEIMDIEFLKSPQHQHFFAHMDKLGAFFHERLTDSVYRTMAVAMFLHSDKIEFFNEIGLKKDGFISHCPLSIEQMNKCACDTHRNDMFDVGSCSIRFSRYINPVSIIDTAKFVMSKMENK